MFTKTKRTKSIIIAALLALLVAIAGFFFVTKEDKKTVTASADTGFYLEEGMALYVGNVETNPQMLCRFTVNITQDMYDKLSVPTDHDKFLWIDTYTPNDYYLKITRSDGFYVDYHIDPKHSETPSTELKFNSENNLIVYLEFPFGTDFGQEYTYTCQYWYRKTVYYENAFGDKRPAESPTLISQTSNSVTRSVSYVASKVLEYDAADYTEAQIEYLKSIAGITTSSGQFLVALKYQVIKSYGYIDYMTENYSVDSRFVLASETVYATVMQTKGVKNITDFNVVYKDPSTTRIVLQADSYIYSYDKNTGTGTLTITYRDYQYKDFAIRLQDNDPWDAINEYKYLYSDDIEYAGITWKEGSLARITFDYAKIIQQCKASIESWLFDIKPNNITVDDSRAEHVTVNVGDNELTIDFDPAYEEELKNLSIFINAEIVPDHEATVNVNYTQLIFDGNTIVDETVTDTYTMMYSEWVDLKLWGTFKESKYYAPVAEALQIEELNGEIYFIPDDVDGNKVVDGAEYELNVEYSYNTLFAIKDSVSGNVHFIDCTLNTLEYKFEDLKLTPPDGYRLADLVSDDSLVDVKFDEQEYENATVTLKVNSKQKLIIPITATYSDTWYLEIVYLKPYKSTPFAVKTTETFEVGVNDYEDIENMKKSDIIALLGRDNMIVSNIADADEIAKAELTSSSTYTATVTYGEASWKQIDYEGNSKELRIPLTSYADWCKSFGEDWTIMYLNRYDRDRFFEYTNEVNREDLYGFFSVAVFQEKVSNLNYYFANSSGDGQMIVFEENEVKGNKLYEFFGELKDNIFTSLLGYVGMSFCETFDKDNGVYQSVYFYLDGSTKQGALTRNDSDDPNDTDSAFENATEDFFDDIEAGFEKLGDKIKSSGKKILKYCAIGLGCIVGGGVAIGVGVKLGKKFYRWATTDQPKKQPAKRKKKKGNKRKSKK